MKIAFACPECHKRYAVESSLSGQMAKCSCGKAIQVPTVTTAAVLPNSRAATSTAAAMHNQVSTPSRQTPQQSTPLLPTKGRSAFAPVAATAAAQVATWDVGEPPAPKRRWNFRPLRYIVGIAAFFYGLWFPFIAFKLLGLLGLPVAGAAVLYAPFVLIGAILVLIGNRWGPGVTALAMLFGTFFEGYGLMIVGAKEFVDSMSLKTLVVTIFVYLLPALIFVWCAIEERRRPPGQIRLIEDA